MHSSHIDDEFPEIRTFDIASELSPILRSVLDYSGAHGKRFGEGPAEGSQADLELKNTDGTMTEQRRFDIGATHENATAISIQSAGYLLNALTQLYRPDMSL